MVGSSVVRALAARGCEAITRSRVQLDLCNQKAVTDFFAKGQIDTVIFCAGKVGEIYANSTYPADFMQQNLAMAVSSIHAAYQNNVRRFLYLGSTCIYPRNAPQPIAESCLLTSALEVQTLCRMVVNSRYGFFPDPEMSCTGGKTIFKSCRQNRSCMRKLERI